MSISRWKEGLGWLDADYGIVFPTWNPCIECWQKNVKDHRLEFIHYLPTQTSKLFQECIGVENKQVCKWQLFDEPQASCGHMGPWKSPRERHLLPSIRAIAVEKWGGTIALEVGLLGAGGGVRRTCFRCLWISRWAAGLNVIKLTIQQQMLRMHLLIAPYHRQDATCLKKQSVDSCEHQTLPS